MSDNAATTAPPQALRGSAGLRQLGRLGRTDWLGYMACGVLLVMLTFAVFGPQIAPYDPSDQNLVERLTPPVWTESGTWAHPLGTDELGRDLLSRLIVGARLDLSIGFAAASLELLVGVALGIVAGYRRGWIDRAVMRWCDIQMGMPPGLVVIFALLLFGTNATTMTIALALNGWMIVTRLIRAEVRDLKAQPFVEGAMVSGARPPWILRRHVLPHLRGRVTAIFLLEMPRLVLAAATLNFLGLGVNPPSVSWGLMIGESRDLLAVAYWPCVFPGLMIVITVVSLYIFSSWLEPRLDPLQRNRRSLKKDRGR